MSIRKLYPLSLAVSAFGTAGIAEWFTFWEVDKSTLDNLFFLVGLNGAIGLGFGVIFHVFHSFFLSTQRLKLLMHAWRRPPTTDAEMKRTNRHAAFAIALLFSFLTIAINSAVFSTLSRSFVRTDLAFAFTFLGSLAASFLTVFLFPIVGHALERVFAALLPTGRILGQPTTLIPVLLITIGCVFVVIFIAQFDLSAWRVDRWVWLGMPMFAALCIALRFSRPTGGLLAVCSVLAAATVSSSLSLSRWEPNWSEFGPQITLRGRSSYLALAALRSVFDGDGDGFSKALGGGDCDDENPKIGPHAKEIPGNGIDENCLGGDGLVREVMPPDSGADSKNRTFARARPYNIVIILVDTLRSDHMGVYGYGRATTPNIDRWARRAIVFENAFAQAPNTPRSIPSLFTGRYPSSIDWVDVFSNYGRPKPNIQTLFTAFSSHGWRTEAVSAHWYFEMVPELKNGVHFWDNTGFQRVKPSLVQITSPLITQKLLSRLDHFARQRQRFVLFAHYFDPHSRYMKHDKTKSFGDTPIDLYDGEISFTDHHLAPVLRRLDGPDFARNTVVILTSDHGEAFGEHGLGLHGRTVYNEELKVPLLIKVPEVSPKKVKAPVALLDVFPTLGTLTGVPARDVQGESLVGHVYESESVPVAPIFSEQLPYPNYKRHLVCAIDRQSSLKIIRNMTDNEWQTFDLMTDPDESNNMTDLTHGRALFLRTKLEAFIDGQSN